MESKAVRLAASANVGVMLQHLLRYVAGNGHDGLVRSLGLSQLGNRRMSKVMET